jgi:hypothetical protein
MRFIIGSSLWLRWERQQSGLTHQDRCRVALFIPSYSASRRM